jgi:hypothetical protein
MITINPATFESQQLNLVEREVDQIIHA